LGNTLTIEQIFTPGNAVEIFFSQYIGNIKSISAEVKAFQKGNLYFTTGAEGTEDLLYAGAEVTLQYKSSENIKYLLGAYRITEVIREASILISAKPWESNSLQYRYFAPQVETPWKVYATSLRRFFRVKVDLPFYYTLDEELTKIIQVGRIMDLSVGGLFAVVNPDPRLLLGSRFNFELHLPKVLPLELRGEVVRSQTIENTKLGIALDFLNISEDNRDQIARYLTQNNDKAS
jgi:hypothetical protein